MSKADLLDQSIFSCRHTQEEIFQQVEDKRNKHPLLLSKNFGIPKDVFLLPLGFMLLLMLPFWLLYIVPLVVIYAFYRMPTYYMAIFRESILDCVQVGGADGNDDKLLPAKDMIPFNERTYDVVVFGVTGHSGLLLAEYLIERYVKTGKLKIALAGRSKEKVEAQKVKLKRSTKYEHTLDIPVIVADSKDLDSLYSLVKDTRVVSTTVGPYLLYGEPLVNACAKYGTSYNDLTGEGDFMSFMEAKYNQLAKKTNATIICASGYDSIPSCLGTICVVNKFKDSFKGEAPYRVDNVVHSASGGIGNGTLETIYNYMDNGPPLTYKIKGKESKGKTRFCPWHYFGYNKFSKSWTAPYMMAPINTRNVTNTNDNIGFLDNIFYNEIAEVPSLMSSIILACGAMMAGSLVYFAPTRRLLTKFGILPSSGKNNPSRKMCSNGYFLHKLIASSKDGKKQQDLIFAAAGDPGGIATATFQGEVAVLLSKRKGVVVSGAGITPESAIEAKVLKEALLDTGLLAIK